MKLLFVHDHRFKKVGEKLYSNGGLGDGVLRRYTAAFNNVAVAARIEEVEEVNNYSEITLKNVTIKDAYEDNRILKELIKQNDCIIFRLPSKLGIMSIKYAKKYKKPYLIELVGCPWDALWNHSLKGKIVAPIMWYMTRKVVKNSHYTVYVSEKFLAKRYPTKGKELVCSDVSLLDANNSILEKRIDKINSMDKTIVLGTVAAVNVKYKGQQYVIEAISKLKKEGYNIRYRLAGGGDKSFLKNVAEKAGIADSIEFCGAIPHNEIFEFYDNLDVYIQPSLLEGLPRSVVEAMSRACPVLGTNAGGIVELVDDRYLFKKKNINDMCKKIKAMINKDNLSEQARRSFERAGDFEKEKLDIRREKFYKSFKDESVKNK